MLRRRQRVRCRVHPSCQIVQRLLCVASVGHVRPRDRPQHRTQLALWRRANKRTICHHIRCQLRNISHPKRLRHISVGNQDRRSIWRWARFFYRNACQRVHVQHQAATVGHPCRLEYAIQVFGQLRRRIGVVRAIVRIQHFDNHHLTRARCQRRRVAAFGIHCNWTAPSRAVFFVRLNRQTIRRQQRTTQRDRAAQHRACANYWRKTGIDRLHHTGHA